MHIIGVCDVLNIEQYQDRISSFLTKIHKRVALLCLSFTTDAYSKVYTMKLVQNILISSQSLLPIQTGLFGLF